MKRYLTLFAAGMSVLVSIASAQEADAPYKILRSAKVGGEGGFDYVYADVEGRRLYIPRTGPKKRISVFNLDTLEPVGEIADVSARGVAVDPKSHHAFSTSKPVVMWDSETLKTIKTIPVKGDPDGILFDAFNDRVYILSHSAPNATVIDSKDGSVVGTIDLGGAPEQGATDLKGHLYIDLEDKDSVAVVDVATMKVTGNYGLGESKGPAGLAFDVGHNILFVECREPAVSVIMDAKDGKIIKTMPIGANVDGAEFSPQTMEAISSQGDGTLTIIKEKDPATFKAQQTLKTMPSAKTMTIDTKTGRILLIGAEFGKPAAGARRGAMVPGSFMILEVGK